MPEEDVGINRRGWQVAHEQGGASMTEKVESGSGGQPEYLTQDQLCRSEAHRSQTYKRAEDRPGEHGCWGKIQGGRRFGVKGGLWLVAELRALARRSPKVCLIFHLQTQGRTLAFSMGRLEKGRRRSYNNGPLSAEWVLAGRLCAARPSLWHIRQAGQTRLSNQLEVRRQPTRRDTTWELNEPGGQQRCVSAVRSGRRRGR